ncbi:MAG: DUF192 domain-containing protein [Gammaproteobacteria bacterium]
MNGKRAAVTVLSLIALLSCAAPAADEARLLVLRGDGVRVWFDIELAVSADARRRGLMQRDELHHQSGMWFDFGRATAVAMWMKDTLIPLDMAFVAANGEIVAIRANTEPLSETLIPAPQPVRYVLETNAGRLAELAITSGDRVMLPAR